MPFLSSPTVTSVDADSAVPNVVYTTIQDYIFSGGAQGFWYDTDLIFTDTAGTTAVTTAGGLIAHAEDQSGNGHDATQATTADRPQYQTSPERMVFDKVADSLEVTIPTGGWTGTMVLATDDGTASYGVDLPAGTYDVGGRYMPGGAIIGVAVHNGALSEADSDAIEDYFVSKGATASYSSITGFNDFWRGWDEITSFPLIDTSSGTNFSTAWFGCSSLTSFPLIDTSSATNLGSAWQNCTSLTSFPLIDTSSATNLSRAWQNCSSLTSFPLIDTSSGADFSQAWYGCNSLTSFPLIDTSSGTNFFRAWYGCNSLTSFPLIDTSSATNLSTAWFGCTSLTSFPLIDTSSGTNFSFAWYLCTSLSTIPAGLFDAVAGGNFSDAFFSTNLTQTSIDNILASLVTSGVNSGTRVFTQSGGSAPSSAGETDIDTLRSRGWTVTVTGGY